MGAGRLTGSALTQSRSRTQTRSTPSMISLEVTTGSLGYLWIGPGREVSRNADEKQVFEPREKNKNLIVKTWINPSVASQVHEMWIENLELHNGEQNTICDSQ